MCGAGTEFGVAVAPWRSTTRLPSTVRSSRRTFQHTQASLDVDAGNRPRLSEFESLPRLVGPSGNVVTVGKTNNPQVIHAALTNDSRGRHDGRFELRQDAPPVHDLRRSVNTSDSAILGMCLHSASR